jgi:hypothetical protein
MVENALKIVGSTNRRRPKLRPSRELRQALYDLWVLAREEARRDAALRAAAAKTSNITKRHAALVGRSQSAASQVSQSH